MTIDRDTAAGSASRPRRSTTRSTTPSASAWSRHLHAVEPVSRRARSQARIPRGPGALNELYVPSSPSRQRRCRFERSAEVSERPAPLVDQPLGQFPAATISFNLAPGASLGDAVKAIERRSRNSACRRACSTSFQGAALAFRASLANELLLILAAIVTMYIVLGVLYESFIHPITILSTLPSAGVGALLALMLLRNDLGDHRASSASSC